MSLGGLKELVYHHLKCSVGGKSGRCEFKVGQRAPLFLFHPAHNGWPIIRVAV